MNVNSCRPLELPILSPLTLTPLRDVIHTDNERDTMKRVDSISVRFSACWVVVFTFEDTTTSTHHFTVWENLTSFLQNQVNLIKESHWVDHDLIDE